MSPRTPLAKIATAALAGSLVLGGGVALAALSDSPDPTDATELGTEGVTGQLAGALDDVSVDEAKDAVEEAKDALKDAKEAAKEARHDADDATDDDGDDGAEGDDDADAGAHPSNHGQAVSAVAHATPPGPGHGKAVSAVARGAHGPSVDDDEDEGQDDEVEDEAGDDASSQDGGHGRGRRGSKH